MIEIFYVCIVLVGIFLVCVALIWMVVEKKNARDYRQDIDERRYELQQMIEDADKLLTELNNFSTYIVDRLEEKQQILEEYINIIDEKIELLNQTQGRTETVSQAETVEKPEPKNKNIKEEETRDAFPEKKGKLISLDDRKREVIKLYRKGISSTEIERMLNKGKGEIELISRMCR